MIFSVVIAVRNEKNYIERCIESLFNQDYKKEYEVIIIDGMSNDGTYELLKNLQKKYNFKLFKNKKINAAAGRNIGIKNSLGRYIAFIDGDAIAEKDWLSQNEISLEKNNVAGVGGPDLIPENSPKNAIRIGQIMSSPLASGGKFNPSTQHSLSNQEKYVDHIPTCNLCIKKCVFEKIGFFDETFFKGQDLELNYRLIKSGNKLIYSPKIKVYHYRKNNIKDFIKQIYKWAKAKIAIIKKHGFQGLLSHIYLWPAYLIIAFLLFATTFFLLDELKIFLSLLILALFLYIIIIFIESIRIAKKFQNFELLFYALLLLPLIHISYSFGVIKAIFSKKIWKIENW